MFTGVFNVLVTTPLWVVNTRLKLQGIKFKTEHMENDKKKKYRGIVGEAKIILE